MDDHSSDHAVADAAIAANPNLLGQKRPRLWPEGRQHAIPIWHCSRWGLPCRRCCQQRGGLLPHRFTLTCHGGIGCPTRHERRSIFCGAVRRVAPPGRYPAPCLFGVRTFLPIPYAVAHGTKRSSSLPRKGRRSPLHQAASMGRMTCRDI